MKKFNIDTAKKLRENKEYDELFHYCQANCDDAEALACLAICYLYGYGVEVDYQKSFFYDNRSAEMGCANGMAGLAYDYLKGIGTSVNEERAIALLEDAIVYDSPLAYRLLGNCYKDGCGIERNLEKAVDLYSKAIELGDKFALRYLGECYEQGLGVEKNEQKAIGLYTRAVELGDMKSAYRLGIIYSEGREITKDMDKAISMFRLAAEGEHAESMRKIAECYMEGVGVEKNERLALEYYEKASQLGNAEATCDLALCYKDGVCVVKDHEKAIQLLKLSIEQGYEFAMYYLACLYEESNDYKKENVAFKLLKKLAKAGYAISYYKMGQYLQKGIGTTENIDEAIVYYNACIEYTSVYSKMELGDIWESLAECYRKRDDKEMMVRAYTAAIQIYSDIADTKDDDGYALYNIGCIYDKGANEIRDYSKAFKYYESALYRGYLGAVRKVAECYEYGKGVKEEPKKAFAIVEQYSQCDMAYWGSYYTLIKAVYYDYGIGTKRNVQEAIKIYQTFINNDIHGLSDMARFCLACYYYHSHEIEENGNIALQLFRESNLPCANLYIDIIENKNAAQMYSLSKVYFYGYSHFPFLKQDYGRAFELCKAAYEVTGDEIYAEQLARFYFKGIGTSKNLKKAYELLLKCNNDETNQIIGEYYYYGCIQKQDFFEAIKRFDYGNRGRNTRARLFLGLCYLKGNGVKRDIDYALDLLGHDTEAEDFYSKYAKEIRTLVILSDQQLFEKYEDSVRSKIEELSKTDGVWKTIFDYGEVDELIIGISKKYLVFMLKRLEIPYLRRKPYLFLVFLCFQVLCRLFRMELRNMKAGKERPKIGDLCKEIAILKEALQEREIESKYKDAIIQEKEQYITELSQQVHYYQDDLKGGLTDITKKLDEVNERTKDIKEDLIGLVLFVKNDLMNYIKEQKRQLQVEIKGDFEKYESNISKVCKEISNFINAHVGNSAEVDIKRESEYLKTIFGESWDKIMDEAKTSLVSASVLWKLCAEIKGDFDYSGICISATSALESELKRYFFVGFQDYIEEKYGLPNAEEWERTFNNWPEILLSTTEYSFKKHLKRYSQSLTRGQSKDISEEEKPVIERGKIFTLGKVPFIFGTSKDKYASNEQIDLLRNRLNEYLQTLISVPKGKEAIDVFVSADGGKSFVEKCEQIRINYRNKAAHDDILSEEQAKECYHEVIGKIESFEYTSDITGLLLHLYQFVR